MDEDNREEHIANYITVYSMLFAVVFSVITTRAQDEFQAFMLIEIPQDLLKLLISVLFIWVLPTFFFAYALTDLRTFSTSWNVRNILRIMYWVTPSYGGAQTWLFFAKFLGWFEGEKMKEIDPGGRGEIWWIMVFFIFLFGPYLHVYFRKNFTRK